MDVVCANCAEPCDVYHLEHDMEPKYRAMFKRGKGCDCCEGRKQKKRSKIAVNAGLLLELLGDDIDGIAGMLDDMGNF